MCFTCRIKESVNNGSVVFLLIITLELFVYMCCPPLSFPALCILVLVFSHLDKVLFMIRQDIWFRSFFEMYVCVILFYALFKDSYSIRHFEK